jgi:hypothetical protein
MIATLSVVGVLLAAFIGFLYVLLPSKMPPEGYPFQIGD